jgi:RimJ/RimL family protein N-acetyltransferase
MPEALYQCAVDHPRLRALFDTDVPNSPALWAVLNGRHKGQALVDDRHEPSQCVLRTNAVLTYFSSQTEQSFLNEAVARVRKRGPVWIVWPDGNALQPPAAEGMQIISRLEFLDYDPESAVLAEWRRRLPAGFSICPIDRSLLKRCEWREEMEFYCGSLDNFLANGLGLCLTQGDEIIVEAYASAFGQEKAEIGAITHERYRGRGFAAVACAYLMEACTRRGYRAYWSCDADNLASLRVARKLGFRHVRAYKIFDYEL